jgi:tetratricopeptide (TPR) repeat protein
MKEGTRYILRNPIDRLDIPGTVQGIIAARMDRLSEDLKKTMQVASVIGRDFAYKILRSILELGDGLRTNLTNLVGLEVLYEKTLYPELEYIFKHALTQEVAYESLLKQRRREIHGRIAQAIEGLYSDKLEQHYELLAHHWELSDNPDRSIEYLVLAGEKSSCSQAATAAVNFFTRALNQLEKSEKAVDPKLMMRIRVGRANPFHSMGKVEESFGDYQEAISIGRKLGDQQSVLDCLAQLPLLLYSTALKDKVPSLCEEGLDLAGTLQDKGAQARIMASYAYWRYLWRRTEEYENFQEALKLAKQSGKPPVIFFTHLLLSLQERWIGNPRQSLKYSEGMVEMLQSVFNIILASSVSITRGWALTDLGNYNEAIEFQSQWIDILERNSIYVILGRVYNGQGWTYSEVYDLEKASAFNKKSLENAIVLRKKPAIVFAASEMQAMAEVNLMENKFEMGMIEDAWKHITRFEKVSIDSAYDLNRDRWSPRMKILKGTLLLNRGDLDGAEQLSRQSLEVASKRGFKKYVGRAERLLGIILTKRTAYNQAEARFKSAQGRLEEVENPKQLWITHAELARLYKKMNRSDLEREQWQKAAQIVTKTSDELQDNDLKETFISAPPIRQIIAGAKP